LRRLIINADDFGYDTDTTAVTAKLLRQGIVRSATILLGFPESEAALKFASIHSDSCSFGLHFNIAEDRPLAQYPVPSLVNASGQFRGAISQRLRALTGQLHPADIAREAETQLGICADHGVKLSHIDSHGHFHKFPLVLAALRPVLARFNIKRVRRPQTLYDNPRFYNRLLDAYCNRGFNGFASTDHFFNTRSHDPDWFERFLTKLPNGITELGIHPGHAENWRIAEALPFEKEGLSERIVAQDIDIWSFHDIGT
jgi:chitin disaccharide deacetylase